MAAYTHDGVTSALSGWAAGRGLGATGTFSSEFSVCAGSAGALGSVLASTGRMDASVFDES